MADELVSATSANANVELVNIIETLSKCLTEQQPPNTQHTAPSGFDDALRTLRSDAVSQGFATKGFWSWLAYFLADTNTCQYLSTLSSDTIVHVADQVSKTEVDITLIQRVQHTLYTSNRASSRRKLLLQLGIGNLPARAPASSPLSSNVTPQPSQSNPLKRRRDDAWTNLVQSANEAMGTILERRDSSAVPEPSTAQISDELERFGNPNLPPFEIDRQRNYAYPDAGRLPFVFEHDLGSAIVRYGLKAAVLLAFEDDPDECKVIIEIQPSDVIWLAMNFYGVRIREQGQQRAVIQQGITSLEIIGTLRFQQTDLQIWEKYLGAMISNGIQHCRRRLGEKEQGFALSRCLTLEVPGAANVPCRLTLVVDVNTASLILSGLWQC
ncbi:hypothetical protein QSH57_004381 [Fusarium oxysporum f. sp. vasinfectum]|nr:hypothetical protein QSH57_004381 [Fusarium oxysporum f. sp. vasinfectum]